MISALAGSGLPEEVTFLDADCTHFSIFFSRAVMLRATFGWSFPINGGCGLGEACGRFDMPADLDITGTLVWNFDIDAGDH